MQTMAGLAARVWFMFHAYGHNDVAILDGGREQMRAEHRRGSQAR